MTMSVGLLKNRIHMYDCIVSTKILYGSYLVLCMYKKKVRWLIIFAYSSDTPNPIVNILTFKVFFSLNQSWYTC